MNYTVKFLPDNKTVVVPSGTTISDAAHLAGCATLHLPCGGRGTCGKCIVSLSQNDIKPARDVQACKTVIKSDCTITLPKPADHSKSSLVADAAIEQLNASFDAFSPLCRSLVVTALQPVEGAVYSDKERLEKAICPGPLRSYRKALTSLAFKLRENKGAVTVILSETSSGSELIDVISSKDSKNVYGISCDIGTTTVAVNLVNLIDGSLAASAVDYNGQISRGADVISRIDYARTPAKLDELRSLALETVNRLIAAACAAAAIPAESVYAMVVAGNCTMTHLVLGLPPKYIREAPYVPTVNKVPLLRAVDCSFSIHPDAPVLFSPGVGSYVGGDITSGLLCTEMIRTAEAVTLFIDIGTNGEIVIGNKEFLLTCACSAGPAFEGSGIACGMRADQGAIDSFIIDAAKGSIDYTVIGNGMPKGICGSGLISLLGELLAAGYIDRSGKITDSAGQSRKRKIDGTHGLLLVPAPETEHHRDLVITEADIDNLIRTKAAIYAACDLMLSNAGLDFKVIDRVLIAGGFGKYIDLEAAIKIGLFPDIDRGRFSYLGNTSLAGATRALLSQRYRRLLDELSGKMTYIDLSAEPRYMEAYVAALFLPHTELEKFPSAVV
jgi:uncharacterized 2Fe-2S/4Fe-4S cluster protein (DUF4445 family)